MADFDTTLGVRTGLYNSSHPSIFQTPLIDEQILNDVENGKKIKPTDLWKTNNTPGTSFSSIKEDPSDPPFTQNEKDILYNKLEPVIETTFVNTIPSLLFCFFFSKFNIETLQKNIRFSVNKWSGHHVGNQSLTELLIIMEKIFSENAQHIDENKAPSKFLLKFIYKEIARLNEFVLQESVPIIINQVEQHILYLKTVDNPVSPLALQRPQESSITGTKIFRSTTDIFN